MTDITNIPKYILDDIRRNVPFGCEESFTDEELSKKTKRELFEHYLNWNGLIGYAGEIINAIECIFDVELLEDDEK